MITKKGKGRNYRSANAAADYFLAVAKKSREDAKGAKPSPERAAAQGAG